jgi:hypothetical protein
MVLFVLARADHLLLHPLEILLQTGLGLGREPDQGLLGKSVKPVDRPVNWGKAR